MSAQRRSRPSRKTGKANTLKRGLPVATPSSVRLVQVGLGFDLLPALLVVLAVGAIGVLILAAGRLLTDIVGSQSCHPRGPIGPESLRS